MLDMLVYCDINFSGEVYEEMMNIVRGWKLTMLTG